MRMIYLYYFLLLPFCVLLPGISGVGSSGFWNVRYGLEDSQSCLFVADLERLDRATFLEQMGFLGPSGVGFCFEPQKMEDLNHPMG